MDLDTRPNMDLDNHPSSDLVLLVNEQQLIGMLERFEIMTRLGKEGDKILLPSLLPNTIPDCADEYWRDDERLPQVIERFTWHSALRPLSNPCNNRLDDATTLSLCR